ncbi:DUF1716-domain-containing protein [Meira miltonrushii]|uniref:DUF1716-domain-containing protein n=1 Tax=Meira miltonrushii TaxID=1280837 RepID=A0A316V4T4_9BASI|nr:DUF1716-domain-containing protein [Meira miltonrushii]PWN32567.1 DUF1716-domain-containing protein [Meira miltonrushii]
MDVDKLFKLPKLPQSSINKRKWQEPDANQLKAARVEDVGEEDTSGPSRLSRVQDIDQEEDAPDFAPGNDADYFIDEDDEGGRFFGGGLTSQQKRILELMNGANANQNDEILKPDQELRTLRKNILRLERSITKNQEMRVKYPDDPQKFLASEADLHDAIRSLVSVTTNPALLYPELVKQNTTASLCSLLAHENIDIAAGVIELLEEIFDDDVLDAGLEGRTEEEQLGEETGQRKGQVAVESVLDALSENSLVDLLVQTLPRLQGDGQSDGKSIAAEANAESDSDATFHLLGLMENLISLRASLADELFGSTFLKWILAKISPKTTYDQNKGYAAELLCILLQAGQSSEQRAIKFGKEGGIDQLLNALAPLRKTLSIGDEVREFYENLFDALCVALTATPNKKAFHDAEGVELMCLIMKASKGFVRLRCVKLINHATSGPRGSKNCTRFVECQGLKVLFHSLGNEHVTVQDEDNVLEIIASLLNNLASDSVERIRLISKFVEKEYEKLDRLVEVHFAARNRLQNVEVELRKELAQINDEDLDEEEWEADAYIRRLDGGMFTLQLADYCLAWLIMEDDGIQKHVKLLFDRKESTLDDVVKTLQQYHANVGEEVVISEPEHDDEEPLRLTDVLVQLVNYILPII